jgi:hypothetical protein
MNWDRSETELHSPLSPFLTVGIVSDCALQERDLLAFTSLGIDLRGMALGKNLRDKSHSLKAFFSRQEILDTELPNRSAAWFNVLPSQ